MRLRSPIERGVQPERGRTLRVAAIPPMLAGYGQQRFVWTVVRCHSILYLLRVLMKEDLEYECSDCGTSVKPDTTICPKCGADLEQWIDSRANVESTPGGRADTQQQTGDDAVPLLYSKKAIYVFSFLFSVLFGAVLMIINLRALRKPEGIVPTASFSLAYVATAYFLLDFLEAQLRQPINSGSTLAMMGGILFQKFVWERFIGADIKYRKRSIVAPLIIGMALGTLYIVAYFLGRNQNA
jgi:hypothetical protein